ncbi:MAG TPA: PilZ domain-containing protein [Armatimonadota bacterium]
MEFEPHFAVNDSVKLRLRGKFHSSRVEDMDADGLWVAWPSVLGVPVRLHDNDEDVVLVSSVSSGMQGFKANIIERREGPPAVLRVVPREAVGAVQRRDYARVPDTVPVRFRILDVKAVKAGDTIETTSRNISGGGLLVFVERQSRPFAGDRLALDIDLPQAGTIRAQGQVIWVDNVKDSHELFEMALRFVDIREADRQTIIRRVYARQAELHRAGLM